MNRLALLVRPVHSPLIYAALSRFDPHSFVTLLGVPRFDTHSFSTLLGVPRFDTHSFATLLGAPRFDTHSLPLYCECRALIHIHLLGVPRSHADQSTCLLGVP